MKFDYIGKKETLKVELRFSKVKLSNVVTKIAISSSFYIGFGLTELKSILVPVP